MPPFVESQTSGEAPIDHRHPLYLGTWKRSIPGSDDDFAKDDMDEPHLKRKFAILSAHPEVEKLYGTDVRTLYVAIANAAAQVALAYYFGQINFSLWQMLVVAYFLGGSLTALSGVLIHEACHSLVVSSRFWNRIVGLIANINLPVPIAQSFRRYHLEHHTWQGVEGMDPDLPLDWERTLIRGNALKKTLWILIYPFMYVIRGAVQQHRQNKSPSKWELINVVFTICTDAIVVKLAGWRGLGYLFVSLWFGYSLHPGAAHFVQEHYTFDDGQETYSYYGVLNIPFMNIGYHNEHHDFQKIPWSGLPALRSIAREYYDSLSYHTSWLYVHWKFITEPSIGPQSRVYRTEKDHKEGRTMLKDMRKQFMSGRLKKS
ncbi:fatty acid desaturase-domain-containing protein [Umbelopsis sp. PMI_123]|nr:fatty acid desaturase-domain-containing protein [Umbelopsis sp. PMI_123]